MNQPQLMADLTSTLPFKNQTILTRLCHCSAYTRSPNRKQSNRSGTSSSRAATRRRSHTPSRLNQSQTASRSLGQRWLLENQAAQFLADDEINVAAAAAAPTTRDARPAMQTTTLPSLDNTSKEGAHIFPSEGRQSGEEGRDGGQRREEGADFFSENAKFVKVEEGSEGLLAVGDRGGLSGSGRRSLSFEMLQEDVVMASLLARSGSRPDLLAEGADGSADQLEQRLEELSRRWQGNREGEQGVEGSSSSSSLGAASSSKAQGSGVTPFYHGYVKSIMAMWPGRREGGDGRSSSSSLVSNAAAADVERRRGNDVAAVLKDSPASSAAGKRSRCSQCGACKAAAEAAGVGGDGDGWKQTWSRESMATMLEAAGMEELRTVAIMSALSDMAYAIPRIQANELAQMYDLKYVTTSLVARAKLKKQQAGRAGSEQLSSPSPAQPTELLAAALAPAEASQQEKQKAAGPSAVAPAPAPVAAASSENVSGAYAFALAAASYLLPSWGSPFQAQQTEEGKKGGAEQQLRAAAAAAAGGEDSSLGMEMALVGEAQGGVEGEPKSDAGNGAVCPCEWFVCDAKDSASRYFVIQGSESLASWITNIRFDPAPFEEGSLGVVVHRGIYEAALGLYRELLPHVRSNIALHGAANARFQFTGHSLGGSLATLLSLMLLTRGEIQPHNLLPTYTFGSPSIMCGGDHLMDVLNLPRSFVRNVIMHRDIVPRAFACEYPDHIAQVLRQISSSIRQHPCLVSQKVMYAPMGQMLLLQPGSDHSPFHPLLPEAEGLFLLRHPKQQCGTGSLPDADVRNLHRLQVKSAELAILNSPHPLEILSDRSAYGAEGAISRDHDPRSYSSNIATILRLQLHQFRRRLREERRRCQWQPLLNAAASYGASFAPSSSTLESLVVPDVASICGESGVAMAGVSSRLGLQARAMHHRGASFRSASKRGGVVSPGRVNSSVAAQAIPTRPSVQQLGILALVCILSQALV